MHSVARFDNRITRLFGVDVPIANSPMGFVAKPDLVAAVAIAGGIGLVPGSTGIDGARDDIKRVRDMTDRPIRGGPQARRPAALALPPPSG